MATADAGGKPRWHCTSFQLGCLIWCAWVLLLLWLCYDAARTIHNAPRLRGKPVFVLHPRDNHPILCFNDWQLHLTWDGKPKYLTPGNLKRGQHSTQYYDSSEFTNTVGIGRELIVVDGDVISTSIAPCMPSNQQRCIAITIGYDRFENYRTVYFGNDQEVYAYPDWRNRSVWILDYETHELLEKINLTEMLAALSTSQQGKLKAGTVHAVTRGSNGQLALLISQAEPYSEWMLVYHYLDCNNLLDSYLNYHNEDYASYELYLGAHNHIVLNSFEYDADGCVTIYDLNSPLKQTCEYTKQGIDPFQRLLMIGVLARVLVFCSLCSFFMVSIVVILRTLPSLLYSPRRPWRREK